MAVQAARQPEAMTSAPTAGKASHEPHAHRHRIHAHGPREPPLKPLPDHGQADDGEGRLPEAAGERDGDEQ